MEHLNINELIQNAQLTSDQLAIAKQITSNLHRTAFLSGPELANECNVSPAAITRFSQKLGFSGYPEFKKQLETLYRKTTTPYEMFESFVAKGDDRPVEEISIGQDIENIKQIYSLLDSKNLTAIIDEIDKAENIYIIAIASSEILVDYLEAFLTALNKKCHSLKSFGISRKAELYDFSSKDIVIGFSFQRILKEVNEVFDYVKQFKTKTIAITDSPINPLSMNSNYTLVTPVIGSTFGLSLAAPLVAINLIANKLAAKDHNKSLKILKKVKVSWEKHPIFCDTDGE